MRALKNRNSRRGITIIIFILMIIVVIGFLMIQQMTTAKRKAKQTMHLFNTSYAMNLAEAAMNAGENIMRMEMNNESSIDPAFYFNFREDRDILTAKGVIDLTERPIIKTIAEKFEGEITRLDVAFKGIKYFTAKSGDNVSLDNIEKCGAVEITCEATYQDSAIQLTTRKDFKVTITKSHMLHNYVLFVRDAWDEYSRMPSSKDWPIKYCSKPGSFEGYNPVDHYLKINSDINPYYGKIHFGGTGADHRQKIILNLSDNDVDLMEPLPKYSLTPELGPSPNEKFLPSKCYWSMTGAQNITKTEAKTIFDSVFKKKLFQDKDPFTNNKNKFSFGKKNNGYLSKFSFNGKDYDADYFPTDVNKLNDNLSDEKKWKNIGYPFGAPTYFVDATFQAVAQNAGFPQNLWQNYRDNANKGIDLWGDSSTRTPTPIEGDVYARYISTGIMNWVGEKGEMTVHFPGSINFFPNPNNLLSFTTIWSKFWENMAKSYRDMDLDKQIPIWERKTVTSGGSSSLWVPRSIVDYPTTSKFRNFDTEVHIRPFNYSLACLMQNDKNYRDGMKPFYDLLTSTSSDFTLNSLVKIEPFIDDLMIYNKCTAFYHNAEDFFEDRVFTASDGTKRLFIDGRIVVVGDIYFKEPIYFEGSGILTALAYSKTKKRGNILIGGHFLKAPGAPTNAYITLFAPHGKILVSNPNAKIQAALFALNMNFTSGNRDLHGYLIGAGKQILRNGHMQIQGSLCVDRLNLPTFPTSTTITYDPALIPSTDAADRHRDYHVSLSQTFNYWRRQGI